MSSCQGEMTQEVFTVKGVDQDGEVLVDGPVKTLPNGFMELWLPRDRTIRLTIRRQNAMAEGIIETFDDSHTCITTFQLK